MESDLFSRRQRTQVPVESRVAQLADNSQVHVSRDRVHQVVDSLVGKQAADENHTSISGYRLIRGKPMCVHTTKNDARPRFSGMTKNSPAEFADVEMAVVPAIRGDIRRHIPASPAQISDERRASEQPAGERRQAAGQDVLLMAVDNTDQQPGGARLPVRSEE